MSYRLSIMQQSHQTSFLLEVARSHVASAIGTNADELMQAWSGPSGAEAVRTLAEAHLTNADNLWSSVADVTKAAKLTHHKASELATFLSNMGPAAQTPIGPVMGDVVDAVRDVHFNLYGLWDELTEVKDAPSQFSLTQITNRIDSTLGAIDEAGEALDYLNETIRTAPKRVSA